MLLPPPPSVALAVRCRGPVAIIITTWNIVNGERLHGRPQLLLLLLVRNTGRPALRGRQSAFGSTQEALASRLKVDGLEIRRPVNGNQGHRRRASPGRRRQPLLNPPSPLGAVARASSSAPVRAAEPVAAAVVVVVVVLEHETMMMRGGGGPDRENEAKLQSALCLSLSEWCSSNRGRRLNEDD